MKLSIWIQENGKAKAVRRLERALGCERSYVYRLRSGDRFPGRNTMREIYVETGGAVMPNDFVDLPDLTKMNGEARP